MKKRLLSYLAALLLLSITAVPCLAVDETISSEYCFSEYDWIVELREKSNSRSSELSNEERALIQSMEIEEELLRRKSCTDEELSMYYKYSEEEINILRNYTGERLESNPELRAVTGTLKIDKPVVNEMTRSSLSITVTWAWDHMPVHTLTDGFCVAWTSTHGSIDGNMRFMNSDSHHYVSYEGMSNKIIDQGWETKADGVKSEFKMMYGTYDWASSGEAELYWEKAAGSPNLTSMDVLFVYAHSQFKAGPQISFPGSGSINLEGATVEADKRSGYVEASTKKWIDNPEKHQR